MTNIELETLSAVKAAARKYAQKEIDWEQRRYEIAKDVLAARLSTQNWAIEDQDAYVEDCVEYADLLVRHLQSRK